MQNAKDDVAFLRNRWSWRLNSDHTIADWNHFCCDAA